MNVGLTMSTGLVKLKKPLLPKRQTGQIFLTIRMETCERNVMLGRSVLAQTGWFGWLFRR